MIDELMPSPRGVDSLKHIEALRPNPSEVAISSDESGYIRFIDTQRLIALAKHYHVSIRVLRRVGHFVPAGVPLHDGLKGQSSARRRKSSAACGVRLRTDKNLAAGRGVWSPADRRYCVEGNLARR